MSISTLTPTFQTAKYITLSVALTLVSLSAMAVPYTWIGPTDGEWTTNGNWTVSGFPNTTSDDAQFDTTSGNTNVQAAIGDIITVNTLAFINNGSLTYTIINNGTMTLNNGITNASTATQTISNTGTLNILAGGVGLTDPLKF